MEYQISYLTGYKTLLPTRCLLVEKRVKRRFWFGYRYEYWIESDVIAYGSFKTKKEAKEVLNYFY